MFLFLFLASTGEFCRHSRHWWPCFDKVMSSYMSCDKWRPEVSPNRSSGVWTSPGYIMETSRGLCWTRYEKGLGFRFRFMVFNATFSNIPLYRGGQFYWWRKLQYTEKTTNLSPVTDKLYHISGDRHWLHR